MFLWGNIFKTSICVSTKLYYPKNSNPRPRAKILVKLCSKSFSSFSKRIWVMLSAASWSQDPQKMRPIERDAMA
jgi:hypothetical protein